MCQFAQLPAFCCLEDLLTSSGLQRPHCDAAMWAAEQPVMCIQMLVWYASGLSAGITHMLHTVGMWITAQQAVSSALQLAATVMRALSVTCLYHSE